MTRPKDNLFAKAWFSYFEKISGDHVFLFFLTISDFVDILYSHQNSFADFTDIELREMEDEPGGLEPRNLEG